VRLRWCLRAWLGLRRTLWSQEEASGEEIESRPAKHLALEHLQAVDLALDRSLTPGQRHPGLHGGVILTHPFGKAPEGRESARGGARQPRIEPGRLALAHEGGEVLRERDGLRQGGMFGELRQVVVIHIPELFWRVEHQPGGPAQGERASWRSRHRRPRLRALALPGGEPLGLAHASDIQGHNPILTPKTLAADGSEEMRAIPTPAVPPGQEGGFVRIEQAAVAAIPRLVLGERWALEVALHGAPTEPDLVRNRIQGPALPMGRPDLLVLGHPLGPPRGGEGRDPCGRLRGGERHGGEVRDRCSVFGIVHGRRRTGVLGIDQRQLRGVSPEQGFFAQSAEKVYSRISQSGLDGLEPGLTPGQAPSG
jgi:hypothetical protein